MTLAEHIRMTRTCVFGTDTLHPLKKGTTATSRVLQHSRPDTFERSPDRPLNFKGVSPAYYHLNAPPAEPRTRSMGKRKATDLGLNFNWDDAKMVNALHALTDLRDDILRDRKLKQEAEGGCDEEAFGGGERDPPAELLLKQVISGLERRIEGPTVSGLN